MKKVFLFCTLFVATSAFAFFGSSEKKGVDGYQDIKFGISPSKLKGMKKCNLTEINKQDSGGVEVHACRDFKFNGSDSDAYFYFIDGKLGRVGIEFTEGKLEALATALIEKYGTPSHSATAEQLRAFDAGKLEQVDIAWVNNTIILRLLRAGFKAKSMLVYSSSTFDSDVTKLQKSSIKDSI